MLDDRFIRSAFEHERNIPYRIPLSLQEVDDCCAGKHIRLRKVLESQGIPTRYRICWFKWSDTPIPQELCAIPHEDDCTHLYLEIKIDGVWRILDATWDPGVASVFPTSVLDDSLQSTRVGVPAYKTLSPEDSEEDMRNFTPEVVERDLKINGAFFRAFNEWLENIRTHI